MALLGTTFRLLPWGRNAPGWWLFLELPRSHQGSLWLPDPSAWDPWPPVLSRASGIGSRAHSWFFQSSGLAEGTKPPASSPRALADWVCGLPRAPGRKTQQPRALAWAPVGLIQTKPPQAFAFLSFIAIILIWTRSLDFKVAWLCCCGSFHCAALHSQWVLHTSC